MRAKGRGDNRDIAADTNPLCAIFLAAEVGMDSIKRRSFVAGGLGFTGFGVALLGQPNDLTPTATQLLPTSESETLANLAIYGDRIFALWRAGFSSNSKCRLSSNLLDGTQEWSLDLPGGSYLRLVALRDKLILLSIDGSGLNVDTFSPSGAKQSQRTFTAPASMTGAADDSYVVTYSAASEVSVLPLIGSGAASKLSDVLPPRSLGGRRPRVSSVEVVGVGQERFMLIDLANAQGVLLNAETMSVTHLGEAAISSPLPLRMAIAMACSIRPGSIHLLPGSINPQVQSVIEVDETLSRKGQVDLALPDRSQVKAKIPTLMAGNGGRLAFGYMDGLVLSWRVS